MKKTRKNRYAGSQPEERYGLGTRKSLYLDRPTSHGGWPEGEYDPPINDRIYDYLKSMGLVQETHLRQMIRGILNEAEPSDEFNASTPRSRALGGVKVVSTPEQADALQKLSSGLPKMFAMTVGLTWLQLADEINSGEFEERTIDFVTKTFPDLVTALKDKGLSDDKAKRSAADKVIRDAFSQLHSILFTVGIVWDPADLLDAILYLLEGKPRLALLSIIFTLPSLIAAIALRNPALYFGFHPAVLDTPLLVGAIELAIDKSEMLFGDEKLGESMRKQIIIEKDKIKDALKRAGTDFSSFESFFKGLEEELNTPEAKMHKENSKRLLDNIERIATA